MSALAILTKCPLAKCPLAKCPLAKCRLAKCPLAKCPDTTYTIHNPYHSLIGYNMSQVPANKRMSKDMLENVLLTETNCLYNLIKKSMKKAHKKHKKA